MRLKIIDVSTLVAGVAYNERWLGVHWQSAITIAVENVLQFYELHRFIWFNYNYVGNRLFCRLLTCCGYMKN